MTEEELEQTDTGRRGVAGDEKHASITVVVPSHLKPSPSSLMADPSSDNIISEASPSMVIGDLPVAVEKGGRNLDKINNLVQKEIALGRVGVTREKAYRVIASALEAKKWDDVIDKQGNVKTELIDDLDKQRWGAEMAIKMFGDMIERKEIEHDLGDKTLDRFRAMSVAELKNRAADLLLGRKQVIDAEIKSL